MREFWRDLVREARAISFWLSIDPHPLEKIIALWDIGCPDGFYGLSRILDSKLVFEIDGKSVSYTPAHTDQLMAHLLWGLCLCAERLIATPSINVRLEIMLDGSISFDAELVNPDQATASELREMRNMLRLIKRNRRSFLLLRFPEEGTWRERWKDWNKLFPALAFPSHEAMRKAYSYAREH